MTRADLTQEAYHLPHLGFIRKQRSGDGTGPRTNARRAHPARTDPSGRGPPRPEANRRWSGVCPRTEHRLTDIEREKEEHARQKLSKKDGNSDVNGILMNDEPRYETEWQNLRLVIELRPDHWQAFVYDAESCEVLYAAERMTAGAAKVTALDFALVHRHGPSHNLKPEVVAEMLVWESDVGHAR
jgi:hypothetical protein